MTINPINRSLIARTKRRILPIIKHSKSAHYFTITLSLFSLSFFGLFAIRPTLITAVSLIKSVTDLQKLNIDYENKIGSIIRAQAEYEQIRDSIPLIFSAVPETSQFHNLSKTLELLAQKYNVSINQLQIDSGPISKSGKTNEVDHFGFVLVASGDYLSFSAFISQLTNLPRIINISSIDIINAGNQQNPANLRLTLKATTYYEP